MPPTQPPPSPPQNDNHYNKRVGVWVEETEFIQHLKFKMNENDKNLEKKMSSHFLLIFRLSK